jgi:hypothetical protein
MQNKAVGVISLTESDVNSRAVAFLLVEKKVQEIE